MEIPENLTEIMEGGDVHQQQQQENNDQTTSSGPKRFLLSGFSKEHRDQELFTSFLENYRDSEGIDVDVIDPEKTDNYSNLTHLIACKIARTEKILGSIALGSWILHPSYFKDCMKAGTLLPEAKYEWGNPENPFLSEDLKDGRNETGPNGQTIDNKMAHDLARASFKWRQLKMQENRRPFDGFKMIIHTTAKRRTAFQKMLELGGGAVVNVELPYDNPGDATHCLVELNKVPSSKINLRALADHGVPALDPVYIHQYLIHDSLKVNQFLCKEFRPYWNDDC